MSDVNLPAIVNTFIQERESYDPQKVVDWKYKPTLQRERQSTHPFNIGELVQVKGFLEIRDEGVVFHTDADGRVADNFHLVNPIDPEQAKKYQGLPLESVVRVLGAIEEDFQISNIQNYNAALIDVTSLPLINPNPTEVEATENTQAVIYGEFVGFKDSGESRFLRSLGFPEGTRVSGESSSTSNGHTRAHLSILKPNGEKTSVDVENPPRDYHDRETYGMVRTEDGKEIGVHMPTGKTVFSGGNIENINGKLPEKGDLIRISTRISEGEFFAHWCDPCFLVDPSESRYSGAENLRLTLDHNLDRTSGYIDQGNYSDARKLLAEVRAREVTDVQLDRTYDLVQKMPIIERPVVTDKKEYTGSRDNNYLVDRIDRAFGVRLESMTAEEFTTFARGALSGDIPEAGDHADTTYLFRMAPHMGFGTEQIEDLAVHAIQGRIERMAGKDKPEFADEYVLDQTINTIYHRQTPNAGRIIADTVKQLQAANIELPFNVRECYGKLPGTQKPMIKDGNV